MKTFSQSHYVRRARAKHNIICQLLYVLRRYNIICIYTWPVARSRLIRFRSAGGGGANNDSCTQSTNPYSIAAIKYKCTAGEGCRDRFSAWFRSGSYELIFFLFFFSFYIHLTRRSRSPVYLTVRGHEIKEFRATILESYYWALFKACEFEKKVVYFHQSDFEIFDIKKSTKFYFVDFILKIEKN